MLLQDGVGALQRPEFLLVGFFGNCCPWWGWSVANFPALEALGSTGWAFKGFPPIPLLVLPSPSGGLRWSFQESPEAVNPWRIHGDIPDIPKFRCALEEDP